MGLYNLGTVSGLGSVRNTHLSITGQAYGALPATSPKAWVRFSA